MRTFPQPLLPISLLLMWLFLTGFTLGNLILGTAVSLLANWAFAKLEPDRTRIRALRPLFKLFWIVALDIIRSNYEVAKLVLTNGRRGARLSAFVDIPLRLENRTSLALLAIIVTATPGTAWIKYDAKTNVLLLHVFDVLDEEAWRVLIRDRYEALLLEGIE